MSGEWQPIETAPTDGTEVLVYGTCFNEGEFMLAIYQLGEWLETWNNDPIHFVITHWQPLPEPPK